MTDHCRVEIAWRSGSCRVAKWRAWFTTAISTGSAARTRPYDIGSGKTVIGLPDPAVKST